jgi:hypothetical protein
MLEPFVRLNSYPNEYLAWIICLIPVFGPNVARYAGAQVVSRQKKMMTKDESRRLRP